VLSESLNYVLVAGVNDGLSFYCLIVVKNAQKIQNDKKYSGF
jgi:hypothetical protein